MALNQSWVRDNMKTAERAWATVGIISLDKKRVSTAIGVEELGALVDGRLGYLGGSSRRFGKLVQAACRFWPVAGFMYFSFVVLE